MRARAIVALALLLPMAAGARDKAADRDRPYAWRAAVQQRDHNRLHNWRKAWLEGLDAARAAGSGEKLAAEGPLLDPDAAQNDPTAPDGLYRCRTIKLGGGGKNVREDAAVPCQIKGGHFAELEGQQRLSGDFWRFDGVRVLLLGALSVGDERGTMPYGRDQQRDVLGFFERIGAHRWRLVLPYPAWEAKISVVELTPSA